MTWSFSDRSTTDTKLTSLLSSFFLRPHPFMNSFRGLLTHPVFQILSPLRRPQNADGFTLHESQRHGAEFVGVHAFTVIVSFHPAVPWWDADERRVEMKRLDDVTGETDEAFDEDVVGAVRRHDRDDVTPLNALVVAVDPPQDHLLEEARRYHVTLCLSPHYILLRWCRHRYYRCHYHNDAFLSFSSINAPCLRAAREGLRPDTWNCLPLWPRNLRCRRPNESRKRWRE